MMSEQTVQSAMSIILHAGDVWVACKEVLGVISEVDFETVEVKLKEAQTKTTEAHKVQTDVIQGETRGDELEYSLLLTYAQDMLMTIYNEINIAKQLLKIFSAYEKRISTLGNKDC